MEFKQQVEELIKQMQGTMQQVGGLTSAMMQVQSEILTLKQITGQMGGFLQQLDAAAGSRIKALEVKAGIVTPEVAPVTPAPAPEAPKAT